jgi:hypothetical protein
MVTALQPLVNVYDILFHTTSQVHKTISFNVRFIHPVQIHTTSQIWIDEGYPSLKMTGYSLPTSRAGRPAMDEWTNIAYGAFGLSWFFSALRIGRWIFNADPRAIINAGRWSLVCIAVLSLVILVWLVTNGKWTAAMMLAAFILPVLVQAAPRWRVLLGPLSTLARGSFTISPDLSPGVRSVNDPYMGRSIDPELAERSAAILQAYLKQTAHGAGSRPTEIAFNSRLMNGSANGFRPKRMSTEEALDVLGLDPTAKACEIRDAHRRLEANLAPELGGTRYLTQKINEARDVLLGE